MDLYSKQLRATEAMHLSNEQYWPGNLQIIFFGVLSQGSRTESETIITVVFFFLKLSTQLLGARKAKFCPVWSDDLV